MPISTVNGVRIHHLQAGQGPDLVMVHGLAADLSFWYLRILPHLTHRWRVTLYDQRGHGLSEAPPSGYTTADLADDLAALLDHLGIEHPHLAGHSLGGAVALHHAVLRPRRVRSLALFDCRVPALQPLPSAEDSPFWRERREALRARGVEVTDATPKVLYSLLEEMADVEQGNGKRQGASSDAVPRRPGSRMVRRWERHRTTTLAADLNEAGGLDARAIGRVSHPALLSYGAASRSLPTCHALEKRLPNHRTVIHPGLGHYFPALRPEVAVEDLVGFLDEIEAPDRATRQG